MLKELDAAVAFFRSRAFAVNTKRSYSTHLHSYVEFCSTTGLPLFPISTSSFVRYIAYLAQRLQYSSITKYLNIIRLLCLEGGLPNPLPSWPVTSVLKGVRRVKGDARNFKLPITPDILLKIRPYLNLCQPLDITLWASYLTAFFSLLRISNLLPCSVKDFDATKHLCRGDLSHHPGGLLLHIK